MSVLRKLPVWQGNLIRVVIAAVVIVPLVWMMDKATQVHKVMPGQQKPAEPPAAPKPEHDPLSAWYCAQEFVKDKLKAPSTAEFESADLKMLKYLGDGRYQLTSYVDAENSFGAKLRYDFVCVVRHAGGDKYVCEKCDISGR